MLLSRRITAVVVMLSVGPALAPARADDLLYGYEGNMLPQNPAAGWVEGAPCVGPCTESVQDGHLVYHWGEHGRDVG